MNARVAACELVVAVLDEGRPLDEALNETASFDALAGRDRAFARAMATATLRRLGGIDAVLAQFLDRPLPETAAHGRAMLRIGAAQLLLMETPPHAAVGETVEAANALRKSAGFAKLINAVLRAFRAMARRSSRRKRRERICRRGSSRAGARLTAKPQQRRLRARCKRKRRWM